MSKERFEVEGSIIGWALQNAERVSALREALNKLGRDENGEPIEGEDVFNLFPDNEELIVHLLEDVLEVYEDKAKSVPLNMFEGGEYEV